MTSIHQLKSKFSSACFSYISAFIFMFAFSSSTYANTIDEINFIASAKKPPIGVVFEIVESNESAFKAALAEIIRYTETLKKSLPSIKLAIVSHGTEQFALLKENKERFKSSHKKVQSLLDEDIPVSVCGTHASWYSLSKKDFPDYVDVAATGPAKIREYQKKGYTLVKIDLK